MADKVLDSLLPKINHLAHLQKKRSLTADERQRQKNLRKQYLKRFRHNFRQRLLMTKFVDDNGNDVSSEKVKRDRKRMFHNRRRNAIRKQINRIRKRRK